MRVRAMRILALAAALLGAAFLQGCNGPRISEDLADTAQLTQSKQAIGLFRLAKPDPSCLHLGVQLGVRDGEFFRPGYLMKMDQTAITQVVETILPAGEYHIVSFTCFRARSTMVMSEPQGNGFYRRSFASFTLAPGEVINLGEVRLVDRKRTHGVWNTFHEIGVEVGDWPLNELDRFKSQRPKLYAAMRVRLMTPPPEAQPLGQNPAQCDKFKALQADGKLQSVPAACAATASANKA